MLNDMKAVTRSIFWCKWSEHPSALHHSSLSLLSNRHSFHLYLHCNLWEFRVVFKFELVNWIEKLVLFNSGLLKELVLSPTLLNKCFHHHLHLTFIRHLIHHVWLKTWILHHNFHLLHLNILLDFESLYSLLSREYFATGGRLCILLDLHHFHLLVVILWMVNGVFLEFSFVNLHLL